MARGEAPCRRVLPWPSIGGRASRSRSTCWHWGRPFSGLAQLAFLDAGRCQSCGASWCQPASRLAFVLRAPPCGLQHHWPCCGLDSTGLRGCGNRRTRGSGSGGVFQAVRHDALASSRRCNLGPPRRGLRRAALGHPCGWSRRVPWPAPCRRGYVGLQLLSEPWSAPRAPRGRGLEDPCSSGSHAAWGRGYRWCAALACRGGTGGRE
mmetsp:Transcript_46839/g.118034  ORF Transcript_46839/g.118034 Transcript_46839/m.118034 type:complete len:207 (+) Transcript_46839:21-641(+)